MRPVFVTDNSYLKVDKTSASGAYDTYRTLFLTGAAVEVKKMQTLPIEAYVDRAYDNAMLAITGEHELELKVKGFSYTHATANPATSALATTSNWTKKCTSVKHGPGAILITR
jgi:predicted metal-binding protein